MEKIVFFEVEDWEEEYIRTALAEYDVIFTKDKLDNKTIHLAQNASIISTFIYSNLHKDILSQLPNVRCVATRSTGVDHIDIMYCREKGIIVTNVPTYGEHTVAEHTFALILALSRHIVLSVERTKRGDFSLEGLEGFDLYNKTIGIVGAGHIGKQVIQIAQGFGMNVLAYTRHPENVSLPGVSFVDLSILLESSDIISLHVPHTPDTHHLINMQNILLFKKGCILINTARGALLETQAILEGIEKGIFKGVGLDVLEEECSLKEERQLLTQDFLATCDIKTQLLNHVLLTRKEVIVTPHNAFNSKEALSQILQQTVDNIHAFYKGNASNQV